MSLTVPVTTWKALLAIVLLVAVPPWNTYWIVELPIVVLVACAPFDRYWNAPAVTVVLLTAPENTIC